MNKRSTTPLAKATRKADALWQEIVCLRGRCLLCGRTAPICGHHIHGKKARPDLRHNVSNGACVCYGYAGNCHDYLHYIGFERSLLLLADEIPEQLGRLAATRYEPSMGMACVMEAKCEELRKVLAAVKEAKHD